MIDFQEEQALTMEYMHNFLGSGVSASSIAEDIERLETILETPGNIIIPGEEVLTLAKGLRAVTQSNLQVAEEQRVGNFIALLTEQRKHGFLSSNTAQKISIYISAYVDSIL